MSWCNLGLEAWRGGRHDINGAAIQHCRHCSNCDTLRAEPLLSLLALSVQSICTVRKGSTCRVSLLYDRTLRQLPVIGICVIREELWDCQGQTLRVARRKSIISEKLFGRQSKETISGEINTFSPLFYRKWIWAMLIHGKWHVKYKYSDRIFKKSPLICYRKGKSPKDVLVKANQQA